MNNREYFWDKPLREANEKFNKDTELGIEVPFDEWFDLDYIDLEKGKIVRGRFFSHEEIEEKIRKMEDREVTGYLLEWQKKDGSWVGSEFDPITTDSNLWLNDDVQDACDDWHDHEVAMGYFKELPNVWFESSDDWDFRLGVDFDSRSTPQTNPSPVDIWGGVSKECNGDLWRVRKVTIKGTLSDNAKEFFRRNPDIVFKYAE